MSAALQVTSDSQRGFYTGASPLVNWTKPALALLIELHGARDDRFLIGRPHLVRGKRGKGHQGEKGGPACLANGRVQRPPISPTRPVGKSANESRPHHQTDPVGPVGA
jgi:hypothetical protein